MKHLLTDTLRFLKENFDEDTSWIVPPSLSHLKNQSLKVKEPLIAPFQKIEITPPLKEEKKEEPFVPVDKTISENPKTIVQTSPLGIDSLSSAVKGLFPQFTTHKTAPLDKDLRIDPVYKKLLQAEVILFSFREGKESDLFLQNICFAIQAHFCSCAVFDVKKWEISEGTFDLFFKQKSAKLFIASETLYKKPPLLPFFKENPTSSEKFLAESKLIFLKPFETYLNNPLQKKELWKILCATLKKSVLSQA